MDSPSSFKSEATGMERGGNVTLHIRHVTYTGMSHIRARRANQGGNVMLHTCWIYIVSKMIFSIKINLIN